MDIEEIFDSILARHRSVELADLEFKRLLDDDAEAKEAYREWCHSNGYSERYGYVEYCNEVLDAEESRYETLNDPDEL